MAKRTTRRMFNSQNVTNYQGVAKMLDFETNRTFGNSSRRTADRGRVPANLPNGAKQGRFMSRGDRNAYATMARYNAQNQRTNNTYYRPASKEEWNRQHISRYNNIRSAFGLNRT